MDFIFFALLVFFFVLLYVVPAAILVAVAILMYKSLKQSFKKYGDINDVEISNDP